MYTKFQRKLPIPQEVKQEFPLSEAMAAVKAERDRQIREPLPACAFCILKPAGRAYTVLNNSIRGVFP